MAVERSKGWDNEIIMITHGDCLEDAEYVAKLVREKMGVENVFIHMNDRFYFYHGSTHCRCLGYAPSSVQMEQIIHMDEIGRAHV